MVDKLGEKCWSKVTSLNQLNDKQIALLNELAYADIGGEWEGKTLLDTVKQAMPGSKFVTEIEEWGLGDLIVKDYVNNNEKEIVFRNLTLVAQFGTKTFQKLVIDSIRLSEQEMGKPLFVS